jgi:rhodanese-related sulfurtransferase
MVVACDLPQLAGETVACVLAGARAHPDADVVVACTTQREPACALWRQRAAPTLRASYDNGERSIHGAFALLAVAEVGVGPGVLQNVNTTADLAALSHPVRYARTVAEITVDELAKLGAQARVVDVREPHEWADGHIAHAVLVPLATVPDHLDAFDGAPTYVICHAGGRSARACEFVGRHGIEAVNVVGGMAAWDAQGLPVETGADGETGG